MSPLVTHEIWTSCLLFLSSHENFFSILHASQTFDKSNFLRIYFKNKLFFTINFRCFFIISSETIKVIIENRNDTKFFFYYT